MNKETFLNYSRENWVMWSGGVRRDGVGLVKMGWGKERCGGVSKDGVE